MEKIIVQAKGLVHKGIVYIYASSVINKILCFFTNIYVVKFLTKSGYGILGYSNNILSLFLLFSGLGLPNGILQFCSEDREEKEKQSLYSYGFFKGLFINTILSLIILIYSIYAPIKLENSRRYIMLLAFMPIIQYVFEYMTIVLRSKKLNKDFAKMQSTNVVLYFTLSIAGAYKFGIEGVIFGKYASFILSAIFSLNILKGIVTKSVINDCLKIELLKYSFICCVCNCISQLLYLLDIFFIGIMIADELVIADYKVATLIPNALLFIPTNLMIFIYPYFAEKKDNKAWIKKKFIMIIKFMGFISLFIGIFLYISAPFIIRILWGESYLSSISCFRILAISFIISSTFRMPAGNILAMMRKVNVNLCISIISGIANIIFDILLIRYYGAVGAAIATISVVIISSIIVMIYIINYLNKG